MIYKSAQNMNIRPDHNVNNSPIGSLPANTEAEVLEVWDAISSSTNVMAGDKWARIDRGWLAVVHMGKVYATLTTPPVVVPPPTTEPQFPQSFTLTDPATNKSAEYVFVKEL